MKQSGRKYIIFSPVILPFVLQKHICKGVISVINSYLYPGFRGAKRTRVELRRPLTRLETHCDFRILQFLQFLSESNKFFIDSGMIYIVI